MTVFAKNSVLMNDAILVKNAVLVKDAMLSAGAGLCVLCAAMLFVAGMAFADDGAPDVLADAQDSVTIDAALDIGSDGFSEGSTLQVGMPIEQAIELLGADPDSETEVGGACGMLDILTWDEAGTRIISVDGTVTSIVEGANEQR
jgi:hypothetical protein